MIFWFQFTQTYCLVEDSSVILAGIEERRPRFFYTVFYSNLFPHSGRLFFYCLSLLQRGKKKKILAVIDNSFS